MLVTTVGSLPTVHECADPETWVPDRSLKLVLFDCDGTLVDSQHAIVAAMADAWEASGLGRPDEAAVRRGIGLPVVDAVAQLLPELAPEVHEAVAVRYKDAFRERRQAAGVTEPLFPGVVAALDALEESGMLLGVATGKSRRGLLATLEHHGILRRFSTLQTADDAPGKPNPHMVLKALAETGADAAGTVVVGDTTYDVRMARNAGVAALGVAWGYHEDMELLAAGAARVCRTYEEVPGAVAEALAGRNRTEGGA